MQLYTLISKYYTTNGMQTVSIAKVTTKAFDVFTDAKY